MNRSITDHKYESGFVSLLTVIFFMIFISLIVVGFLGLVIIDQKQTTENDLSASALAAARGGIEDGKRILLYCQANPANPNCTNSLLNSTDNCDLFKAGQPGANLASTLQMTIDPVTGQGVTGNSGAEQYQQYFTCLTLQRDTPYMTLTVNSNKSYIQSLKTTAPINQLTVSWSGSGGIGSVSGVTAWPKYADWNYAPPVLQVQFIPYSPGDFSNLDGLESKTRTVYIAPCTLLPSGNIPVGCIAMNDLNALDLRGAAGSLRSGSSIPLTYGGCSVSGVAGYECSTTLSGFNAGDQYYARISVLYASSTTVKLAPKDSLGNSVTFDNVQPWIDATGRTNDVFRRVRAQVTYSSQDVMVPQNAIDSAAPVCKDMVVTTDPATSTYNCP